MKNTFLILIMFLLTFSAQAQETGKLELGIKAGGNFSNVYDTKGENFKADPKIGGVVGGFFSVPLGSFIAIQPEVLLSQKGFIGTGTLLGSSYSLTRTTTFMDVPIFVCFKPVKYVSIMAGPQFSYLIKQRDVFENGTTNIAQELEFKNDNIRKNILCFIGGIDVSVKKIVIGVRAGWDVQNNNGDGTSTTPRYKNVWYQATLGYKIF